MLSIGAGAQQQVMAFIEDLGVRNLIVEAREAQDDQAFQKVRRISPGLTFQDLRTMRANVAGIQASTARKRFVPTKVIPKPSTDMPTVYGVEASYQRISGIRLAEGRFLTDEDQTRATAVAVLGEGVRASLFGGKSALGEHVKVNEQWLRVVGVAGPQLSAQNESSGLPAEDRNNIIYTPLSTAILRLEDAQSQRRDEIDGIYLQLATADETVPTSRVVRGLLNDSHKEAGDFSIVVPAELLAQQRRTQRIFEMVMVAIASISLLVGGIGIMNIMLASILERTKEIGIRRAVGAQTPRDHPAVPARGDAHLVGRRTGRRPRGLLTVTPDRRAGGMDDHRLAGLDHPGVLGVDGRRSRLRRLPRPEGRSPRSRRVTPLRVSQTRGRPDLQVRRPSGTDGPPLSSQV